MTPAGGPSAFGLSHRLCCIPRRAVTGKIRITEDGRRVAQRRWTTDHPGGKGAATVSGWHGPSV